MLEFTIVTTVFVFLFAVRLFKTYFLFAVLTSVLLACNLTRRVPDDYALLNSNDIELKENIPINDDEINDVIKQRTNRRTLGFRLRLRAFNSIDSTKTAEDRVDRYIKYRKKNKRKLARQERINKRRIERSLRKGDSTYRPKSITLKDTIEVKPTFRERIKYDYGEAPVIYDSASINNSVNQIRLLLQKNGYFDAEVSSNVEEVGEKKVDVHYQLTPKEPYLVDSISLRNENRVVRNIYNKFIKNNKDALHVPFRFDSEDLEQMRKSLSIYMRNNSLYGFKESYVSYEVDTLNAGRNIQIAVDISKRFVGDNKDDPILKPFDYTTVKHVYFHLLDTLSYDGNFYKNELKPRGIELDEYDQIPTFDTLHYDSYTGHNPQFRTATFLYNGKLTTKAELIEFQNYLEETNYYKGRFMEQSYNRLNQLQLFKSVQPSIVENDDHSISVHYYLIPRKKQTFSFEPKGTHANSFLGLSSSLNYSNHNIFNSGKQLKISFSGGFESQPEVFSSVNEETVLNDETRSFNTLEFGPSIELTIPGLFPMSLNKLSKRQNPLTTISAAYNYQLRPEFKRQTIQLNYLWKFYDIFRTQVFSVGLPVLGGIQFVRIDKTEEFKKRLQNQNDLFLINAYSNQAIYKDVAVSYDFTNPDLKDGQITFSYGFDFDMAGMVMSLITKNNEKNANGFKEFLGQRYSQFIRLDNEFRLHQYFDRQSVHYRLQIGGGVPLENNGINLPYDYSFFGGGSNDNRGFRARTLGPGTYKYYLDSNSTVTEMGDMRLGASFEYRFKITDLFEGAFFTDIGNVWTYNEDKNRPGGQISEDFYKQLSVSGGLGLRVDFSFLILRLDVGIPLRNPALPKNARWIFQDKQPYIDEGIDQWGVNPSTGEYYYKELMPNVFKPQLHIAIGYPF